jgi:peptidoglycan DL-endopeptidase RipA
MKRIYGFILGLTILVAPMAAMLVAPSGLSGLASADPTTKPMDYQQVTDTVVQRGLAARGVPFSWAGGGINGPTRGTGSGINTVGFDASGLMQYAYAGAGIKLPRSSGAMYQVGQKIAPPQAQKGDLIFYGPNGTQSVAMFLGNGQMLEVGDVVQVSPVRSTGMTPYVVRVLGTQQTPLQQAPAQQLPGQPAPVQQAPLQQTAGQAPAPQAPVQAPAQPAPAPQAPVLQIPGQPPIQLPTLPTIQLPGQPAPAPAQQAPAQPTISTFR